MKLGMVQSREAGFDMECHAADCKDLKKKWQYQDRKWFNESIEEAKDDYEGDNDQFEAESGEGAGYYWDYHVKVYPCAEKEVK
jgi:hypothetical protein